ncbi:MAG: hypothetical protein R3F33_02195 [Planctomycetota bacterium]
MKLTHSSLLAASLLGWMASPALADVVTIAPKKDNTLFEFVSGTVSNGSGVRGFAGRSANGITRNFVVQFDIAANVPAGSTINSVSLAMTVVQMNTVSPNGNVQSLHTVSQAWGEGSSDAGVPGGAGAPAAAGDATWLHTFFNTSFWTNPGGDYNAAASATLAINAIGTWSVSSSTMTGDVQNWLDNPGNNFGYLLRYDTPTAGNALALTTREGLAADVPTLTVDFTPPGAATFCDPADNNSTGVPTVLAASPNPGVGSGFHLEATSGPPTQFGYVLVGSGTTSPGVAISNGHLCLDQTGGNVLGRYNIGSTPMTSIGSFDAGGVFQNLVGTSTVGSGFDIPTSLPLPGSPTISAGQVWHFQMWHRDVNTTSNFSNGVSVTF